MSIFQGSASHTVVNPGQITTGTMRTHPMMNSSAPTKGRIGPYDLDKIKPIDIKKLEIGKEYVYLNRNSGRPEQITVKYITEKFDAVVLQNKDHPPFINYKDDPNGFIVDKDNRYVSLALINNMVLSGDKHGMEILERLYAAGYIKDPV